MNYIRRDNEKAVEHFRQLGLLGKKFCRVYFTDSYYNYLEDGWNPSCVCYIPDVYASCHVDFYEINWNRDENFHKYLKENNLLFNKKICIES